MFHVKQPEGDNPWDAVRSLEQFAGADTEALTRLMKHWQLLKQWNEKLNLTAVVEEKLAVSQHYVDCVLALPLLNSGQRILDIGCGAGFPSLVWAACRTMEITAVDAVKKKTSFVHQAAVLMGIASRVMVEHRRLGAGDELGRFDVVTSRAWTAVDDFLDFARVGLNERGYAIAFVSDRDLAQSKLWPGIEARSQRFQYTLLGHPSRSLLKVDRSVLVTA